MLQRVKLQSENAKVFPDIARNVNLRDVSNLKKKKKERDITRSGQLKRITVNPRGPGHNTLP